LRDAGSDISATSPKVLKKSFKSKQSFNEQKSAGRSTKATAYSKPPVQQTKPKMFTGSLSRIGSKEAFNHPVRDNLQSLDMQIKGLIK
jgi:hypothetical protein